MSSKPLISVIGSLNIDFVTTTSRVPDAGETITARSLEVNAGGKGANQAVACGKASFVSEGEQDVEVEMVGAVGNDDHYYASLLRPMLHRSGVSTRAIREVEGCQTGTATILVEEDGQNRILVVPGANYDAMREPDALFSLATQQKQPAVLVLQGEIPSGTIFELLESFANSTSEVLWNPAPVPPEGVPQEVLRHINCLIVNESECILLGKSVSSTAQAIRYVDELEPGDLEDIARDFHDKASIGNVIVTLGSKGVFYSGQGGTMTIPGIQIDEVIDTTAAGDTFVGYFAVALARHLARRGDDSFDMRGAITTANAAAAMCVQKAGAMQSIPFNYEVRIPSRAPSPIAEERNDSVDSQAEPPKPRPDQPDPDSYIRDWVH